MSCDLVEFAAMHQQRHDAGTTPADRKTRGHFGTPPAIAEFMAGLFSGFPAETIRILDPGAGVGILTAAVCARIAGLRQPCTVVVEVWENDPALELHLLNTMGECQRRLESRGHRLEVKLHAEDFVLAHSQKSLFNAAPTPRFDLAILNPPYFKLRKDSDHARAMAHLVYGQPNIYAFFMAVAAELLVDEGQMVAITPRSYFNGPYFRAFRRWFFRRMTPRRIHLFESRVDAFKGDDVLQESVVLSACKTSIRGDVTVTSSNGRDFQEGFRQSSLPYCKIVDETAGNYVVRMATNSLEQRLNEVIDSFPHRLGGLGLGISTGPVVSFRATPYLLQEKTDPSAPLLWMHNVRPFVTRFRPSNGKPSHIRVCEGSMRLLLPAKRYVLLKRFTAKEERRRLVAGIVEAKDSYCDYVGLENHLNYVHKPKGELTQHEAIGLAALFNSRLIDRYFRAISGNTQVNAAEIRSLPLPDLDTISRLGRETGDAAMSDPDALERLIGEVLGLPDDLIASLCQSSK